MWTVEAVLRGSIDFQKSIGEPSLEMVQFIVLYAPIRLLSNRDIEKVLKKFWMAWCQILDQQLHTVTGERERVGSNPAEEILIFIYSMNKSSVQAPRNDENDVLTTPL